MPSDLGDWKMLLVRKLFSEFRTFQKAWKSKWRGPEGMRLGQSAVAHACNLSCSRGRGKRNVSEFKVSLGQR
jgi:hypothetical protein